MGTRGEGGRGTVVDYNGDIGVVSIGGVEGGGGGGGGGVGGSVADGVELWGGRETRGAGGGGHCGGLREGEEKEGLGTDMGGGFSSWERQWRGGGLSLPLSSTLSALHLV